MLGSSLFNITHAFYNMKIFSTNFKYKKLKKMHLKNPFISSYKAFIFTCTNYNFVTLLVTNTCLEKLSITVYDGISPPRRVRYYYVWVNEPVIMSQCKL